MLKTVTIAASAVTARLLNADDDIKRLVNQALTYEVAGKEHIKACQEHKWDGKLSMFNFTRGEFPAGFVNRVRRFLEHKGYRVQVARRNLPPALGPAINDCKGLGYPEDARYWYQKETIRRMVQHRQMIAQIATGGGKCFAKGTQILMADGTRKKVEEIVTGDALMGPDNLSRHVTGTATGYATLYRITPRDGGEAFVVNADHILSLKVHPQDGRVMYESAIGNHRAGSMVLISVRDFIASPALFKKAARLWRTDWELPYKDVDYEPYTMGRWLGDYFYRRCNSKFQRELFAPIFLQYENAHSIPTEYLTGNRRQRMELLAGIYDTCGRLTGKSEITFHCAYQQLAEDVAHLAHSVGFKAEIRTATMFAVNKRKAPIYGIGVRIRGELHRIPCAKRLSEKRRQVLGKPDESPFGVSEIGKDDYYGFEVDKDHLFLLGDGTVTHNSAVATYAVQHIARPTLFVTTRGMLMYQMKTTFEKTGMDVGVVGDSKFEPNPKGTTVAMVQTLAQGLEVINVKKEIERLIELEQASDKKKIDDYAQSLMKQNVPIKERAARRVAFAEKLMKARTPPKALAEKVKRKKAQQEKRRAKTLAFLQQIELLILEEAHEASADGYYAVTRACTKAEYRLALTGTPFMRDEAEANYRLMACAGSVSIKVTEKELIECGILATPYFYFAPTEHIKGLGRGTAWQRAYRIGIKESDWRNDKVVSLAIQGMQYGLSVMVFVLRKEHGSELKKRFEFAIQAAGLLSTVEFVFGDHAQSERLAALNTLTTGPNVVIGSTIMDVGVDVPAVGMGIFAGGGKAEVAHRQRIGRLLRAKKTGPNICFLADFTDSQNKILKEHADQRRHIVESTPGFAEHIVDAFDFSLLDNKS